MAGWRQLRAAAPAAVWPYAALTVVYLLSVLRVVGWAGLTDPAALYWHDWQDQSLYVRSATALATGDLAPSQHYYPLLYPLLGLPFLQLWPSQPFFFVNLACYLLAFGGFRSVARSFGVPLWGAVLLFAGTTLAQFDIAKVWIEPWTSTPAAALLWLALGAMAQLWEEASSSRSLFTLPRPLLLPRRGPGPSREPVIGSDSASLRSTPQLGPGLRRGSVEEKRAQGGSRSPASILGLALGLIPFARPGDVIIGAIIALAATAALIRARDGRAARYAAAGFILSFGVLATLFVAIYGFGPSPYMLYSAQYGFNFSWLGWKAYVLLVEPRAWFGEGVGLLDAAPWLLLGGAGILVAWWTPAARRPVTLAVAAAGAVYVILMLAYVDLLPTGLWRFNNVHYFKWVLPLFGLFALRFVLDAWRRPVTLIALLPIMLALTIRIDPVPVEAHQPARMVVFPAPVGAAWTPTYFATAWLTDARGEQRNSFDYHQILVGNRVRAVALRRPFAGDERWIGDDHVRAQLEGRDTGGYAPLYLTGPWPKTTIARYGARISFGLPHWFEPRETARH